MDCRCWGVCSAVVLVTIGLASCGGGGGGSPAPVAVGGMVSGLAGTGLVLTDNGTDLLSVPHDGSFTFAKTVPGGSGYSVSVLKQPASPSQTCGVAKATGQAVTGNVTVTVACTTNQYTVGGTVSGLDSGRSVVLQDNGGDNLTATASGAITFATKIASGSAYAVTVLTQPTGQSCTVTAGSGTMQANDTNTVSVSCSNVWTWMSGANTADPYGNVLGTYGTLGVASTTNAPGERFGAMSWTDNAGNLWLFGGSLLYTNGQLNDLWKYTPSTRQWTWVSGANAVDAQGIYGTLGAGSTTNIPGARTGAISWTDNSGNLWLFGGFFNYSTGAYGQITGPFGMFNDLWKYTPSSQQWTWMGGANTANSSGVYGTLGVGSTANVPEARGQAISWTDHSGNLWLFGGAGFGLLNDLWEYTPSSQKWTWVSGANTGNAPGIYGTLGAGSTTNTPGARSGAISWTDNAGNFWLFGGLGNDSTGAGGYLNDLWEYTPSSQQWTWVSGANTAYASGSASGVYGTLGVGSTTNVPGARVGAVSWTDTAGNLWLFGGLPDDNGFPLNDLWKYTLSTQQWTWMGGANTTGAAGTYGVLGIGSTTNVPGARQRATSWTDNGGNFWLFGGQGNDSTGAFGLLGDLWRY